MKSPNCIEFHEDSNKILLRTLLSSFPNEGCALLLGKRQIVKSDGEYLIQLYLIWPCCNIWSPEIFGFNSSILRHPVNDGSITSKKNRFAIDPREQLYAQKWARNRNMQIFGHAHSHPTGENRPSQMDLFLHKSPGLMVISNNYGNLKAWWIKNKFSFNKVKIKIFSLT